jgi:hypothetical protein
MPNTPLFSLKRGAAWMGLVLHLAVSAQPQHPDQASLLGLTEPDLQVAVPGLQHLKKAVAGPRGLRGQWAVESSTRDAKLNTTFYLRQQRVAYIEQRWTGTGTRCSAAEYFDTLASTLEARLGPGVFSATAGAAAGGRSGAWAAGEFDVRIHLLQAADQCQVLMVHAVHEARDPSQL